MTLPNDVDFTFQLWPHGWSTARLWVDNDSTEFQLTHVFNDPLESLLTSTIRLLNGEPSAIIEWFDEPGKYNVILTELESECHLLSVDVFESPLEFSTQTSREMSKTRTFCVAREYWLHLVISELRKIADSFGHRHYRTARNYTFPRILYDELQTSIRNRGT